MLTRDERTLFVNIIDATDRIFDRESKVIDLYAILFATAMALPGSKFNAMAESPIRELRMALQSKELEEQRQDLALTVTDELRKFVADELRSDARENPRQRHRT